MSPPCPLVVASSVVGVASMRRIPTPGGPAATAATAAAAQQAPARAAAAAQPAKPAPEAPRQKLDGDALMAELGELTDASFAALMRQGTPARHSAGERVVGKVVRVSQDALFIDIGGKAEATIDATEWEREPLPQMGDKVSAFVVHSDGRGVLLSRRLSGDGAWDALEAARESGAPVDGKVSSRNPGGFSVRIGSVNAFCPVSHIDRHPGPDLDAYVGRTLPFVVIDIRDRDVVVSHRVIADQTAQDASAGFWAEVSEGDDLEGVVTGVKDFGAFVDVNGVRGLVPTRELGWGHDVVAPAAGSTVRVRVIGVDRENQRLTLSLKGSDGGPWSRVGIDFVEGEDYSGKVTRAADFGLFISLAPGLEGLAHISELSKDRVRSAEDVAKPGDTVQVRILEIDAGRRRLQLSLKQAGTDEPSERGPAVPRPPASEQKLGTLGDLFGGLKLKR